MFKRRRALTRLQSLREVFWPSMGWVRATYYAKHRIVRLSSTTRSIATGLACGACVSFTPFFGCHFFLALGYAWLMRGHFLASIIGTFVGNPWTFPFLFWTSFEVGKFLLGLFGVELFAENAATSELKNTDAGFYEFFTHNFWDFYLPTALGGTICMILFWPVFFIPFYLIVKSAKAARRRHLRRKWKKKWARAAAYKVPDEYDVEKDSAPSAPQNSVSQDKTS